MNITIENYTQEYQDKIVDLISTIQQQEFKLPITFEDQPDLANINGFYDSFLVAICEGDPVGTIGIKIIDDYAVIRKMFVQEKFRGKVFGTAQKLIDSATRVIAEKGINKIYLGTTEFFKAAHRFYEKNNYLEISKENLPNSFPVMQVDTKFYFKSLKT